MPWTLRKFDSGQTFPDRSFEDIILWARSAQVNPLDALSEDGATWRLAQDFPELQMDWSVTLVDGASYGPTNIPTLREFVDAGLLASDSSATHRSTGQASTVLALLGASGEGPTLEPLLEIPPAEAAPPETVPAKPVPLPPPSAPPPVPAVAEKPKLKKKQTASVTLASLFARRGNASPQKATDAPTKAAAAAASEVQIQPLPAPANPPPPPPRGAMHPSFDSEVIVRR